MSDLNQNVSLPKSASVVKLHETLKLLVTKPLEVDEALRLAIAPALSTQGTLAAFEHTEAGIVGMSLNTQKAVAKDALAGGYDALNDYRKAALIKLRELETRESAPGRGTIVWYKNELAAKNVQLSGVADDIALMSQYLDEILELAQDMSVGSGKLAEFKKRRGELLRKFGNLK
jgi:hypothetical protein